MDGCFNKNKIKIVPKKNYYDIMWIKKISNLLALYYHFNMELDWRPSFVVRLSTLNMLSNNLAIG